jgi:hypothetical protein
MLPSLDSLPTIFDLADHNAQHRRVPQANVAGWRPPSGLSTMVVSVPSTSAYALAYTYQHQPRYPSLDRARVSSARTSAHPYARPQVFNVSGRTSSSFGSHSAHGSRDSYIGAGAYQGGYPSLAGSSMHHLAAPVPSFAHGILQPPPFMTSLPSHPTSLPQSSTPIHATFGESGNPSPLHTSSPACGLASSLDDSASLYSYSSSSSNSPPPSSLATPGPELRLPPLDHEYTVDSIGHGIHGPRVLQTGDKRAVSFWDDAGLQLPPPDLKRVQV